MPVMILASLSTVEDLLVLAARSPTIESGVLEGGGTESSRQLRLS
mgnify:CR=1 FL=1